MGGSGPLVIALLLCLLSRALLPGFAQEVSTNQNADLVTEAPAAATFPSTALHDSASAASGFLDAVGEGKDNETTAGTDPPPSEGPPPAATESAITEAPQGTNGSAGGTAPSQASANHETRGATGPNLTQPTPTAHTLPASPTQGVTAGTPSILTESPLLPGTGSAPTQNNTESPPGSAHPAVTTALRADRTSPANLPTATEGMRSQPAGTPATPHTGRAKEERDPSLLEVGGHKEIPDSGSGSNPLFVMIVAVFTVMVVIAVVAVGFHRYKKRNRRTDFRRLQDLPMDDMMEDTPLALYSY